MSLAKVSFLVMRNPTKRPRIPLLKCFTYSEHESKGLAVSALRARPSSFQKHRIHHVELPTTGLRG